MVFFKYIVIGVPYPGEGTQNGDNDEDVGDDATGEHRWVLDGTVANYVDDLVDQPSTQSQKVISSKKETSYAAPESAQPE
jgi:hypothetical protein